MAASKQASTYVNTHFRNAVPLVWGSLRLAPINSPASCLWEQPQKSHASHMLLVLMCLWRDHCCTIFSYTHTLIISCTARVHVLPTALFPGLRYCPVFDYFTVSVQMIKNWTLWRHRNETSIRQLLSWQPLKIVYSNRKISSVFPWAVSKHVPTQSTGWWVRNTPGLQVPVTWYLERRLM